MNYCSNKRLPSEAVCARYGVVRRTLYRWMDDPDLGFPAPAVTLRGRHYFDEDALAAWERLHAAPSGRKAA